MKPPKMTCKKCNHHLFEVKETLASNGITHVGAYCSECGAWLRWLPAQVPEAAALVRVGDIEIPFGKHKGKKLKDIPRDYLEWLAKEAKPEWQQ